MSLVKYLNEDEMKKEMEKCGGQNTDITSGPFYMDGRMYTAVLKIALLRNVKCLILSNNALTCIKGLEECVCLIALYLDHNKLRSMAHIENMTKLKILHMQHNQITCLGDLDKLTDLEEINLAHNNLGLLSDGYVALYRMMHNKKIKILHLEHNFIRDEVLGDLCQMLNLRHLYFKPNPVIGDDVIYRRAFLFAIPHLRTLDGIDVTEDEIRVAMVHVTKGAYAAHKEMVKMGLAEDGFFISLHFIFLACAEKLFELYYTYF